MKKFAVTVPKIVQKIYPHRLWKIPNSEKKIYLTFDDGPIPEVTPWVLDLLKEYDAKATFFCIGDNVKKHPDIFQRILSEGHAVGNHTFNHLNGWKTETSAYVDNVFKCTDTLNSEFRIQNRELLFRPPYGKLTSRQAKILRQKGYKIIMWNVLSYDFDASVSAEECFRNVSENLKSGSIVIFHDSVKAEKNLRYALPKVLEFLSEENYVLSKID